MALCITDHYNEEKSLHIYQVTMRGIDLDYDNFYQFQRGAILLHTHSDQPHDYFVYRDESDRLAMLEKFGSFVTVEPTDETWESQFPPPPPMSKRDQMMVDMLWECFQEAIQEEINSEILEKLGKTGAK